jgi:hypothetical protein
MKGLECSFYDRADLESLPDVAARFNVSRRNGTRRSILPIFFFGVILFGAFVANAQCECVGGKPENDYRGNPLYPTAYDEFKGSEAVFVGEFIDENRIEIAPPYKGYSFSYEYQVKFRVETAWKTKLREFVTVRMNANCVIGFKKGDKYLVYALGGTNHLLRIKYCSRTRLLTKASDDLREFEANGEKPRRILVKTRA